MSDTTAREMLDGTSIDDNYESIKESRISPNRMRTVETVLLRRRFVVPLTLLLLYQVVFALIGQLQAMNTSIDVPNYHPAALPPDLPIFLTNRNSSNDSMPLLTSKDWSTDGRRFAVASFLDTPSHLFGTYSILQQMKRTGINVPYIVVIGDKFPKKSPKEYKVLVEMIGKNNIINVDQNYIYRKLAKGLWKAVFNKLWLFTLVDYDKLIILDQDIFIRQNIMHWFDDYPTPAATQAGDSIEWNSGAMVIEPNLEIFQQMVDLLPNATRLDVPRGNAAGVNYYHNNTIDGWNSGYGQQGFLSSFFTQESLNRTMRMKTMPTEASILSSSFVRPQFQYFIRHRIHIFETIHLTVHKPWKKKVKTWHPDLCTVLREWNVSMTGFEKYNATIRIENDYLIDCPKEERTTSEQKQESPAVNEYTINTSNRIKGSTRNDTRRQRSLFNQTYETTRGRSGPNGSEP